MIRWTSRARPVKGDRVECPECNRFVGFWPDKMNPYASHLMPHKTHEPTRYGRRRPWCTGRHGRG